MSANLHSEAVIDVGLKERSLAAVRPHTVAASAITLSVADDLAAVEGVWRTFEATAECTVFQTFAWHAAWQTHIGDRRRVRPAIVVGRAHGKLLFILPLAVESGHFVRRLVWHAADLCDYNAPLLAPDFPTATGGESFAAIWQAVLALLNGDRRFRHDFVFLTRMPETVGALANPFLALPVALNPSGAYPMTLGTDWEQFYRDKRSSATRRHDRSKRKRLAELGSVEFVTSETCDAVKATLDVLFAQKAASFAARGVPNFLARPGTTEFFRAVGADPALSGIVHLSELKVGGTVAAANLGLIFHNRYYHVLASYDGGPVSRFGPGTAHLHELIAYAIRRGCSVFDFTVGDEAYKRDWCESTLHLYDLCVATSVRGGGAAAVSMAGARLKRFIKQTPALWNATNRLRLMTAGLRRTLGGR